MADTTFRVDTMPTPRLDLYGAFIKDLGYYTANKNTPPPQARSALAAEQEKINKFLQYVNESFIIKGFSKFNPIVEEAADADVTTAMNASPFTLAQTPTAIARINVKTAALSHLYLQWGMQGALTLLNDLTEAVLKVQLLVNAQSVYTWTVTLRPGQSAEHFALFLPDREAGEYALELTAALDVGTLTVPANGVCTAAYGKLKTTASNT